MIRPTTDGLVTLQAAGPAQTIDGLIDALNNLTGWTTASEINTDCSGQTKQITLLMRQVWGGFGQWKPWDCMTRDEQEAAWDSIIQ